MKLQIHVFNLLENRRNLSRNGILVQSILGVTIVASTIVSIWETVPQSASTIRIIQYFQNCCGLLFLTEYLLRLWVAPLHQTEQSKIKSRIQAFVKPTMLIDLVVLLPFFLPYLFGFDASSLRIFRLMRIMGLARFGRFSKSLNSLTGVIKNSAPELFVSLAFSFALLIIAATGIYHFEKDTQPQVFATIPDSIWWAINALTGIWYGDVYPVTLGGKIFAGLISILGVGTIALPAGIIASGIMESVNSHKRTETKNCPHCNKPVIDQKEAA